jgi:hypothetical protein
MVAEGPAAHRTAADAVAELVKGAEGVPANAFQPAIDVETPSGAEGREVRYDARSPGGLVHCRLRVVLLGTTMHSALLVYGEACPEGERTLERWDPPARLIWGGAPPTPAATS